MEERINEYRAYYACRSKRYATHPELQRIAAVEKQMSEFMNSCTDFSLGTEQMALLSFQAAVAQSMDFAAYRFKVYQELDEVVYAKGNQAILEAVSLAQDLASLKQLEIDLSTAIVKEVQEDQAVLSHFLDFEPVLKRIELYRMARCASFDNWKLLEMADKEREELAEKMAQVLADFRKYHPYYRYAWEKLWELRHRKRIPLKDAGLSKRISELETIQQDYGIG